MSKIDLNEITNMHPVLWIPAGIIFIVLGIVGTIAYPFLVLCYKRRWKKRGGARCINRN